MNSTLRWVKRNKVKTGVVTAVGAVGLGLWWLNSQKLPFHYEAGLVQSPAWTQNPLPSRSAQLQALEGTKEFDVLVIGGGATGCGVALDSVTRGLSTALVEKYDISSGTSSRSTKLIHGGVRYLQKAIMNLDYGQYLLVKEALHERANLLQIAPHLSAPLPIMLPVYTWWQVPYFWAGIKVYDWVSGRKCVKPSFVLTKNNALEKFPMLKQDKLKAAIVYYDGQHNDARMNLAIALTAVRQGCCMATHTEVLKLLTKQEDGKERVCGATMRDNMTGKVFDVRAKCVINATGPFTDGVRQMGDKDVKKICQPSAGVHIILPDYYSPESMGLLDPATSDGRIIFFLPWQGLTIAGTTDSPSDVTHHPAPTEDDIQFILKEVKNYLSPEVHVRRGDVQAAWSGIRPLVVDPNSANTQSICRNHVVEVSKNGLITIAGGKWTTYRSMAVDTMDAAVKHCGLKQSQSSGTDGLILDGGYQWTPNHYIKLAQDYGLETDVAKHLSGTYGDQAENVAKLAKVTGKRWPVVGKRLVEDFPYIEAEVKYAIYEYACTAVDVLARRTRLSFLNVHAAEEALPQILLIMQRELGWGKERVAREKEQALELLYNEMGKKAREGVMSTGITLSALDIERYEKRFNKVDQGRKGFITRIDLQNLLEDMNEGLDDDTLNDMLDEVDLNKNGKVELDEFLELMSNVRQGTISGNRLATLLKMGENKPVKITVDRSGGGV